MDTTKKLFQVECNGSYSNYYNWVKKEWSFVKVMKSNMNFPPRQYGMDVEFVDNGNGAHASVIAMLQDVDATNMVYFNNTTNGSIFQRGYFYGTCEEFDAFLIRINNR